MEINSEIILLYQPFSSSISPIFFCDEYNYFSLKETSKPTQNHNEIALYTP